MHSEHSNNHIIAESSSTSCSTTEPAGLSRRELLRGVGLTPALSIAGSAAAAAVVLGSTDAEAEVLAASPSARRNEAFKRRVQAARANRRRWKNAGVQPTSDDDEYPDRRASFTKCLPHDEIGEVDLVAYDQLRAALESGDPGDFEAVPLDPAAARRLANPQAALSYVMTGVDPQFSRMAAAPGFDGLETAAEMGEVYWAALTREVPFREYAVDPTVGQAVADLNGFSEPVGPRVGGAVTPGTFLRGETPGDLAGPFVSQFLWKPVPFGLATIEQRYPVPEAVDFMTDFGSWLAIQRGAAPTGSIVYRPEPRYIYSGRGLGEYVHIDQSYQAYLFAALIASSYGPDALAPGNPYLGSSTQGGFVTHGGAEILDLVAAVANLALRAAWFQKWSAHRRLRPEAYGGRLTIQLQGTKDYGLPSDITDSVAVATLWSAQGNALLPQAFAEGSPTHPAYPAGHAAVAGACATVLKAVFDEGFVIPDPVEASGDGATLDPWGGDDLTLGAEIDKLASNISLARDTAGVHYRSDGREGLRLGEQVALAMLADRTRGYNEDFGGFELTGFDGTSILVAEGEIFCL